MKQKVTVKIEVVAEYNAFKGDPVTGCPDDFEIIDFTLPDGLQVSDFVYEEILGQNSFTIDEFGKLEVMK
jgi:hypothetical protein